MWISLDQIAYLKAISEAGSITAASDNLRRAKSAVYYSIKKLEEQVGFKLVATGQDRGTLTNKGRQLLAKSEPLLREVDSLKQAAHQIATGVEMNVSISTTALFHIKDFNRAIKSLQTEFPDTEITIQREILSGLRMLQRRQTDISIVESTPDPERFDTKVITTAEMALVIAKDHPFHRLKKKQQCLEALFQYPQVVQRSTIPDDDQHGVYSDARRWTVSDLTAKREIILDGLGWGRLPMHDIEDDIRKGDLVVLSHIEDKRQVPIYICRRKDEEHGKVSQKFWDLWDS